MKDNKTKLIYKYANDILSSPTVQSQKKYKHHGSVSVYDHSFSVTLMCLTIADMIPVDIDTPALIRGALLHDYFLYDWHEPDATHKCHAFQHPKRAMKNAVRDFSVGEKEQDIITRHMFPLTPKPPKYIESWILCVADTLCAVKEVAADKTDYLKECGRRIRCYVEND